MFAFNVIVNPLEINGDVYLEGDLDMKENNILNTNNFYVDNLNNLFRCIEYGYMFVKMRLRL